MSDPNYLDNYSPFDDKKNEDDEETPQIRLNLEDINTQQPNSQQATASYSNYGSNSIPSTSILNSISSSTQVTEGQLSEYEENLNLLEHQINQLENSVENDRRNFNMGVGGYTDNEEPNWPKFYPVIHFDLEEVRENLRHYVKECFLCWFVMLGSFVMNWIGTLSLLSVENTIESPGSKIALSSIYLFVLVPIALDLDTVSVYRVMKQNSISTFSYIKIFLSLGFTCLFEFMLLLGMDSSGSVGLISTIDLLFHKNIGCGVFGVFVTISLGVSLFLYANFLRKLWKYYRGTEEGGNMENDLKRSMVDYLIKLGQQ